MLITAVLCSACHKNTEDKNNQQTEEDSPLVELETVREQSVAQIQQYTATVEAEVTNNIAPSSPVRIDRIFVEVGDRVARGQQVVAMDAAHLRQVELQLANQRVEFERTDELYKIGGASKSEWDAQKMAYEVQKTAYEDLKKNTSLRSPVSGVVTARNYDNGDFYSGASPVLVIEQINPVKLVVHISENHYTEIKENKPVDIQLDVYGEEKFEGKVKLIYPTIDPATRTFTVEISVNNKDQRIRPGMFARATIDFGEQQHVVVPDRAVVKQAGSGDYYVYVYKDGKVSHNKVLLGRRMDNHYELISGVPNGARVVVAGQSRLADGVKVRVQK